MKKTILNVLLILTASLIIISCGLKTEKEVMSNTNTNQKKDIKIKKKDLRHTLAKDNNAKQITFDQATEKIAKYFSFMDDETYKERNPMKIGSKNSGMIISLTGKKLQKIDEIKVDFFYKKKEIYEKINKNHLTDYQIAEKIIENIFHDPDEIKIWLINELKNATIELKNVLDKTESSKNYDNKTIELVVVKWKNALAAGIEIKM